MVSSASGESPGCARTVLSRCPSSTSTSFTSPVSAVRLVSLCCRMRQDTVPYATVGQCNEVEDSRAVQYSVQGGERLNTPLVSHACASSYSARAEETGQLSSPTPCTIVATESSGIQTSVGKWYMACARSTDGLHVHRTPRHFLDMEGLTQAVLVDSIVSRKVTVDTVESPPWHMAAIPRTTGLPATTKNGITAQFV
jgi:hypothetical protein